MSRIIRAEVISNSCDDQYSRVTLRCNDIWEETPLVESINGIPLKIGDIVYVDISDGVNNPIILGRALGAKNKFNKDSGGNILYESSNGQSFTVAYVKNSKLEVYNSEGVEVVINGSDISIKTNSVSVESSDSFILKTSDAKITGGTLTVNGLVTPEGTGPFCGLPKCLFSGTPQCGTKVVGT